MAVELPFGFARAAKKKADNEPAGSRRNGWERKSQKAWQTDRQTVRDRETERESECDRQTLLFKLAYEMSCWNGNLSDCQGAAQCNRIKAQRTRRLDRCIDKLIKEREWGRERERNTTTITFSWLAWRAAARLWANNLHSLCARGSLQSVAPCPGSFSLVMDAFSPRRQKDTKIQATR